MGLKCLLDYCRGKVPGDKRRHPGQSMVELYTEDDEYFCKDCGQKYYVNVSDDYEDDAVATLIMPGHRSKQARASIQTHIDDLLDAPFRPGYQPPTLMGLNCAKSNLGPIAADCEE